MIPFEQVDEALFDAVINLNVKGTYFTVQQCLPLMGAGGASYGVLQPLLECLPGQLLVVNRTLDKLKSLNRNLLYDFFLDGMKQKEIAATGASTIDVDGIVRTAIGIHGQTRKVNPSPSTNISTDRCAWGRLVA